MNRMLRMLLPFALAGFIGAASAEEGARVILPGSVEYKSDPNLPGVFFAILSGNPREGAYTVRVKLQPGARLAAHFHPDMRTLTVMAGTYYFAAGNNYDEGALHGYGPGTVIVIPAGKAHFAGARDDGAIVQESGAGPTGHMPAMH